MGKIEKNKKFKKIDKDVVEETITETRVETHSLIELENKKRELIDTRDSIQKQIDHIDEILSAK